MRVVILEDEQPARRHLEQSVAAVNPVVRIDASLASVADAIAWLSSHPMPDLVFADILLSDGLSFEVFERIETTCPVVFCTAYDEYVVDALAHQGIDYILKPVRREDVARAIDKFERLKAHFTVRIGQATAAMAQGRGRRRLLAKTSDGFFAVPVTDIAYAVVLDGGVELVTMDGKRAAIDRTLSDLETELDEGEFFRLNRQYLVSAAAVVGFRSYFKGRLVVELSPSPTDGEKVIVSQENAARFRAWLDR